MNQITVRGFDDDLNVHLRSLAQREGISLNQAALRLLRKGAGLAETSARPDIVGASLDHLIGTWTQAGRGGGVGCRPGGIRDHG